MGSGTSHQHGRGAPRGEPACRSAAHPVDRPSTPRRRFLGAGGRRNHRILLVAFLVPVLFLGAMLAGLTPWAFPFAPVGSSSAQAVTPPTVGAHVQFSIPSGAAKTSPGLNAHPGNTVLVWFSIFGNALVKSVTDNQGNTYSSLATGTAPPASGGPNTSTAVWAAYNVGVAGPSLTVTASVGSPNGSTAAGAAVVLFAVSGVGPSPLDRVGTPSNSSSASSPRSSHYWSTLAAGADELVVSGVAAQNNTGWSTPPAVHNVGHQSVRPTNTSQQVSLAVWSATTGAAPSSVWINATSGGNHPVAWVGEILSLRSANAPVTKYTVAFNATGLSSENWSVALTSSSGSPTTGSSTGSSLRFQEPNGSYDYSVAAPSGYSVSPASGKVTVAGQNPATTNLTFTHLSPPSSISHVVVIVLENQALSSVYAHAPYERYLQHTYANATAFYGACHESLPEYAAMTSGESFTCTSIPIQGVTDLADLVQNKGDSWDAYFEGMSSTCQLSSSGSFVSYHDPFILYKDVRYNSTRCNAHILNSASFNSSVTAGTLPTFAYYVPNIYDDGLQSSVATADTWLKGFLAPLLNSTNATVQGEVSHTAFFVLSDEGSETDLSGYSVGGVVSSWCQNQTHQARSVCGGATYLTVVSPVSKGTKYLSNATDYNVESTVEWLLGLGRDGGNDGTSAFPAMTSLFTSAAPTPTNYTVAFNQTGLSSQNWSVTLTPGSGASASHTSSGGSMSFQEPNGTYNYSVKGPSGSTANPAAGSVKVAGGNPTPVQVKFSSSNSTNSSNSSGTTYTVAFNATGLSGQNWSVTLTPGKGSAITRSSDTSTIRFQVPNGTYSYSVTTPPNYTAAPSSGSVTVSGQSPKAVLVAFLPIGLLQRATGSNFIAPFRGGRNP